MSDQSQPGAKQPPHRTVETERAAEEREARLAAALRANLRRRKAQGREAMVRKEQGHEDMIREDLTREREERLPALPPESAKS